MQDKPCIKNKYLGDKNSNKLEALEVIEKKAITFIIRHYGPQLFLACDSDMEYLPHLSESRTRRRQSQKKIGCEDPSSLEREP